MCTVDSKKQGRCVRIGWKYFSCIVVPDSGLFTLETGVRNSIRHILFALAPCV